MIEDFINRKININQLITNLLIKYIKNDLKNLLLFVNHKYHEKFKKTDVKEYYKKYCKVSLKEYSKTNANKLNIKTKKKHFQRHFGSVKSLNKMNLINKNKKKYNKKDKYCNARTWNNGSITKTADDKIIYGGRCTRLKLYYKDINNEGKHTKCNEYCQQHTIKCKHGNYFEEPSEDIKKLYQKYNK